MQANEFDGNPAFSGGGFMPSQATQTASGGPSSSSDNSDCRCLLPLTVKRLNELSRVANPDPSSESIYAHNISLVGRVSKIDNAVSEYTFRVDDGTGWVECIKRVNEHIDSVEVDAISVGMYVRVYCLLNRFQMTVLAISIRPVNDFNEITNHFIECIYVHQYNTKFRPSLAAKPQMTNSIGGPQVANSNLGDSGNGDGYQASMTNQVANSNLGDPGNGDGNQANLTNQYKTEELTRDISSRVLLFLYRPACIESQMGVSSEYVARELDVSVEKIRKALEYLASEGLVYTTEDDYYKSIYA